MDVQSIGPVAGPANRFSYTEHATKLADANHAARLQSVTPPAVTVSEAPNVTTSPSYSPALYAQAAHFQVLAQAGAFAALHSAASSAAPAPTATAKVASVSGATVSSLKS